MRSFFLSQAYLSTLEFCPRKYQYVYVDRLTTPLSLDQQRALQWGKCFHQLMQQQALGLPLDHLLPILSGSPTRTLAPQDPEESRQFSELQFRQELAHCLHTLGKCEPTIFGESAQDTHQPDRISDRIQESEHSRSVLWIPQSTPAGGTSPDRWILRVIYDRLVLSPETAEILDWKTYPQPKNLHWIRHSWQTRLYLFVLGETSSYAPEQLSMTYWFVRHYDDRGVLTPQFYTIPYDRHAHEQTRTDLQHWIDDLSQWHYAYDTGTPFPMLPESSPQCNTCPFNQRCERSLSSFHQKNGFETPCFSTALQGILELVTDPPATMDSDSLTSEVQSDWRRRQIDRPGKEDRAMGSPPLESTDNSLS